MALSRAFACSWLLTIWLAGPVQAQDGHRIWGEVHTTSGDVHEGFIRWDRNEGSWVDILDGSKDIPEENYLAWLASIDVDGPPVRTIDLRGYRISWDEDDPDFPSSATSGIRFGHLASLRVIGEDRLELTLRSGEVLELFGGSTDIGPSMRELVVDVPGRREVELDWEDLDRVVFSAAPAGARASSGRLYGTVEDTEGSRFTGYVSYDLDEILESDVLDGREVGGDDLDIRFSEITSIARLGGGARVVLIDGTVLDLRGSNDVTRRNRGIQISDPNLGMVEVEWRDFEILRFHEADAVVGYDAFDGGHLLRGTVTTQSGEQVEGEIRWDADEAGSWEFLNGRDEDDVVFTIEFGLVSRIERREAWGAQVTLLDGRTFELEDSNDVDWDNKGILIAPTGGTQSRVADGSRWRVIPWDEFREVRFDHDAIDATRRPGS
jgi:hypothetical protein